MKLFVSNLLLIVVVAGCGGSEGSNADSEGLDTNGTAKDKSAQNVKADQTKIPIEIKSWDETQALVAKQKGKVVIIDLWSTT